MAIDTLYRNDFVGDATTGTYSFTFKVQSTAHLKVIVTDSSGNETALVLNTNFTAALTSAIPSTGTVTLTGSPAWLNSSGYLKSGYLLSIECNPPMSQATAFGNQSQLNRTVLENTADYAVMLARRALSVALRGAHLQEGLNLSNYTMQLPKPAAGKAIGWDALGTSLTNLSTTAISFAGDSADLTFLQAGAGATSRTVRARLRDSINVQDFGAVGDGATDDTGAFNAALTQAALTSGSVFVPRGTYRITALISVPAGCLLYGTGRGSKLQSAIAEGVSELVRLTGDYAAIDSLWLCGSGQGAIGASVNGSRGVWIGLANNSSTRSDHCRVENCVIDQFPGNGISGEYQYAKIVNNFIHTNRDTNIFIPPACKFNLVQGNTLNASRYNGIDVNGSSNRIVGNHIEGNGGGTMVGGTSDWNGIVLVTVDNTNRCTLNIVEGNYLKDNMMAGVAVYEPAPVGVLGPGFGNIIKGNISTGHTNTAGTATNLPAGFWIVGSCDTIVEGNLAYANRDNYLVSSSGGFTSTGVQICYNKSISATRHGYHFTHSPLISLAGDNPAHRVQIIGNSDRLAGADSFKFLSSTVAALEYTIRDNRSLSPTGYCFNNNAPSVFTDWDFDNNYGSAAGTAYQTGFDTALLTVNSTAPSVKNGHYFILQNTNPTTITNFTNGIIGQTIFIQVDDNNTTLDFTSSSLKGYEGADLKLSSGDFIKGTFNGGAWYLDVNHLVSVAHSVTQLVDKSTAVELNWKNGIIATNNAALAGDTAVGFTLNNSVVGANDIVLVSVVGGPNPSSYTASAVVSGAGTVSITLRNNTAGSLSEAVSIGFTVLKS
jgi:hypothetical protein